ncbi:hypothetical protein EW146_g507 [Bondarzewia mesenterica]|uniref:Uncharacterized protein n=1 Tax=Bondarzewia mesenterica TaxID=1095465 RepID=A0A4S4M6N8_9AGAM|nr:hypothetical protein EW146_g507 [Bondarzewia mesenterica]
MAALDWLIDHRTPLLCIGVSAFLICYSPKLESLWRKALRSVPPDDETKSKAESVSSSSFIYPKIDSCLEALENIKPVPYRPFKWGEYHVTMGIKNISFEKWIELDDQFAHYHQLRLHRMKLRGKRVVQTLPDDPQFATSGYAAAKELVHELAEYLSRRYPNTFHVERHPRGKDGDDGWYGEGRIRMITILPPVNATYNLDEEDPMTVAGLLVQDDLALMIEGSGETYYLRSGAICTAGFWRLEDKLGMSLDDIHFSGNVPQYQKKLRTSLNRFIQRLPVDKLIQRNNYFFKIVSDFTRPVEPLDPDELGWAETTVGAEDAFQSGAGLGYGKEDAAEHDVVDAAVEKQDMNVKPSMMRLRMERQTLRRLPKTGAVIFTIRTYIVPVEELVKEVGTPGRMASAIRSWPDDVAGYKSRASYQQYVLPYLDECHKKQVEEGLLGADEQPHTDYPF